MIIAKSPLSGIHPLGPDRRSITFLDNNKVVFWWGPSLSIPES